MKKILAILALTAFAGLAYAGAKGLSYTTTLAPVAPTLPTQGLEMIGPSGQPIRGITVGLTDFNDGGADDDYVIVAAANAWLFRPEDKNPDAGDGWSRFPTLDVSTTYSGGDITLGSVTASQGATVAFPAPGVAGTVPAFGAGQRLFYQLKTFTTIDGGSQAAVVRVTITAGY